MASVPVYSFRPITEADRDLVHEIFRAAMKENTVEAYGEWHEIAQRAEHDQHFGFIAEHGWIIVIEGHDAGFLAIKEYQDHIKLVALHIVPEFQEQGIGRTIIENLLADARQKSKPVRLEVLKTNPARRLYERLGFTVVDDSDEHVYVMSTPAD